LPTAGQVLADFCNELACQGLFVPFENVIKRAVLWLATKAIDFGSGAIKKYIFAPRG